MVKTLFFLRGYAGSSWPKLGVREVERSEEDELAEIEGGGQGMGEAAGGQGQAGDVGVPGRGRAPCKGAWKGEWKGAWKRWN